MKILPALGLIFVTLKLTNYIDWSWWFVTLPFTITFIATFIFGLISILKEKK